jgi:CHAP domain
MITLPNATSKLIEIAQSFIGTIIPIPFLKEASLPPNSPWCMAFIQYCLRQTEGSMNRLSDISKSSLVMKVWDDTPHNLRNFLPAPGRIAIWEKGQSFEGHTGIVLKVISNGRNYLTIEGNSKNPMTGQGPFGVYQHIHMLESNHPSPMRLLGFLSPFG